MLRRIPAGLLLTGALKLAWDISECGSTKDEVEVEVDDVEEEEETLESTAVNGITGALKHLKKVRSCGGGGLI
jgi:hypothetical protein